MNFQDYLAGLSVQDRKTYDELDADSRFQLRVYHRLSQNLADHGVPHRIALSEDFDCPRLYIGNKNAIYSCDTYGAEYWNEGNFTCDCGNTFTGDDPDFFNKLADHLMLAYRKNANYGEKTEPMNAARSSLRTPAVSEETS